MASAQPPEAPRRTVAPTVPKPVPGNTNSIAAQYARAKAAKDAADERKAKGLKGTGGGGLDSRGRVKSPVVGLNEWKAGRFGREWVWGWGFFGWLL